MKEVRNDEIQREMEFFQMRIKHLEEEIKYMKEQLEFFKNRFPEATENEEMTDAEQLKIVRKVIVPENLLKFDPTKTEGRIIFDTNDKQFYENSVRDVQKMKEHLQEAKTLLFVLI